MNYEEKYNEILEWARKNKARLNGVPLDKDIDFEIATYKGGMFGIIVDVKEPEK